MLSRRLPVILAVGAMCVVRAISACATDDTSPERFVNANVDAAASVTEGICPDVAPDSGYVCLLPEGTACAFGACGTPIAQCTHGTWQYAETPPGPPCPDSPPASESACPPCWPATQTCPYGSDDCTLPDASANRTVASCASGTWTLAFYPCADASTDVQGDATADHE